MSNASFIKLLDIVAICIHMVAVMNTGRSSVVLQQFYLWTTWLEVWMRVCVCLSLLGVGQSSLTIAVIS